MLRGGMLLPPAPGQSIGAIWPPVVEDRPILANWRILYAIQGKAGATTQLAYPNTLWRNYYRSSIPAGAPAYYSTPSVGWLSWSELSMRLYIVGRQTIAGASAIATFTIADAHGTAPLSGIPIAVISATDYTARPVLSAGAVTGVSVTSSQSGDAVCQVSASKAVESWDIVSGAPTDGVAHGFHVDSSGMVRVGEPSLFSGDPYVLSGTYQVTVRAMDSAGAYGFKDISVPVSP